MQNSARLLLISVLGLWVVGALGCGACGEAKETAKPERSSAAPEASSSAVATTAAPAEPEEPDEKFDRSLLLGVWTTTIEDSDTGYRMDLEITYTDSEFEIDGELISTDPAKADAAKAFEVTGNWTLEGETLTETPTQSTFPLWRVGKASPATVKILDEKRFVYERSGSEMSLVRSSAS